MVFYNYLIIIWWFIIMICTLVVHNDRYLWFELWVVDPRFAPLAPPDKVWIHIATISFTIDSFFLTIKNRVFYSNRSPIVYNYMLL